MRSKVVDVMRLDAENLRVVGLLNDSIYSLELEFKVRLADMVCFDVVGRWRRWTTPECPRALEFLKEAEGLCLAEPVARKVHASLGRHACRHFANLFLECVYALRQAVAGLKAPPAADPESGENGYAGKGGEAGQRRKRRPGAGREQKDSGLETPRPGEFVVELHCHTAPASPCASDSVEEMLVAARKCGLDALCLTDHNHLWPARRVAELAREFGLPIFRGNEITTDQGDMLVFGFEEEVSELIPLVELRSRVSQAGGFLIAAHPFRGFLTFGGSEIGLTPQQAAAREMFSLVDGIEVLNGRVTASENRLARAVAAELGLPATGGSDAHQVSELGRYATAFPEPLTTEADLVAALRAGRGRPVAVAGRARR
jgi:predicted metal-dependent phosphoesterase TrpH